LLIDSLANRYSCLPSEIVRKGDTFDVYVLMQALTIRSYHDRKADAMQTGTTPPLKKNYSQDELQDIVNRSKQNVS